MATILGIETSTQVCSVALWKKGQVIAQSEILLGNTHSKVLTLLIQSMLSHLSLSLKEIDAVALSKGPGSYTGLRIGTSVAKGICYALNQPLVAVETLHAMTQKLIPFFKDVYFCPMIDARRMEVYCCVLDQENQVIENTSAKIIEADSFSELLQKNKIVFFGDGSPKCKSIIHHPNAIFIDNIHPSAQSICSIAAKKLEQNQVENVAYYEPYYLKDFIALKSAKNKLI